MLKVFISVINYNGASNTLDCLKTLNELQKDDFELLVNVIDNASKEPFDISESRFTSFKTKIIRSSLNTGFSGGHNINIKHALASDADYVLILNNDTKTDVNLLTELLKSAKSQPDYGVLVPKIYFERGYEFHKKKYTEGELGKIIWYAGGVMDWRNLIGINRGVDEIDLGQYDKASETELATGCCMLVKREVFEKIGSFDNRYFLYYEDADFTMRVKKKGFKIIYQPKAILWHKNAGSAGGSGSSLQDYYISRNRLLFGMRYAPIRTKIALLRESLTITSRGRVWQRKGVRDFYLRKFGEGSYNIEL
jgi:GT2 family glycosyltransferase